MMVVSMERWIGKIAVVTGAGAGIGAAIAEQLVEAGVTVVGLDLSKELVEEHSAKLKNKKGELHAIKADVSKEEDVIQAFKWIKDNLGPVYILVNNAAISKTTTLIDGDTEMWKQVMDTNVLGLCIATREAVKDMTANRVDGHIIHINSIEGHMVLNIPSGNVYAASKYAVTALTETLRQELNCIKSKIKITSISPGAVTTGFFKTSGMEDSAQMREFLKSIPMLKAMDVADAVVYVLSTPSHVQVHELTIKPVGEIF